MDLEAVKADCVKACMELLDVCHIGEGSFYTCYEEHARCMGHCAGVEKEEGNVRTQPT
jgi:hypothetical protein